MGKKKKALRVVLDTNIVISSLLFGGTLSKIAELWKKGNIKPFISEDTFDELLNVLSYPKFSLTRQEISTIIHKEILPFFEVVGINEKVKGICRDPHDDKFLSCALSAGAEYIISGDSDLCDLKKDKSVKIISSKEFLKKFT